MWQGKSKYFQNRFEFDIVSTSSSIAVAFSCFPVGLQYHFEWMHHEPFNGGKFEGVTNIKSNPLTLLTIPNYALTMK